MSNENAITAFETAKLPTFKRKELNDATAKIANIGVANAAMSRELATTLASVKLYKWYTDDGFNSVADYAEKTFGIKKANAYQLALVGERFYLIGEPREDEPDILEDLRELADKVSPSKLAEIAKLTDKELETLLDEHDVDELAAFTQKELRGLAKSARGGGSEDTPQVLPLMDFWTNLFNGKVIFTGTTADLETHLHDETTYTTVTKVGTVTRPVGDKNVKYSRFLAERFDSASGIVMDAKVFYGKESKRNEDQKAPTLSLDKLLEVLTPDQLVALGINKGI